VLIGKNTKREITRDREIERDRKRGIGRDDLDNGGLRGEAGESIWVGGRRKRCTEERTKSCGFTQARLVGRVSRLGIDLKS